MNIRKLQSDEIFSKSLNFPAFKCKSFVISVLWCIFVLVMELPIEFVNRMHQLLGDEESNNFFAALEQPSPVSIRLNPDKIKNAELIINNSQFKPVPWCSTGYYLDERLTFTFDPLFHAGVYYVQEASSMFLEQVINQFIERPVLALDLCAAPGGKSTHLRSLLPDGSLLVANEVIRNRSNILAENLTKWGHPDVMVTNNDPADFSATGVQFDVILADVPCSGEGMFRKDPAAINEWSLANVDVCWRRQRRIITDIWSSLKPGGMLIYSTCTYNIYENEENIRWITSELGGTALKPLIPDEWNIAGDITGSDLPVFRFLPHRVKGEGFFLAILQKNREDITENNFKPSMPATKKNKKPQPDIQLNIAPSCFTDEQQRLTTKLKVLQNGVITGSVKGKDIIPSHALAMADVPERNKFTRFELNYEQAITYLRRESIILPANASRGYLLLTYKDIPLGFVKNIGNRANNLYPAEWRIRSGYLPDEIRTL